MEPLVLKNELYSFSFFKKTFENIKLCVDRITASQLKNSNNDPNIAKIATITNYKIYAACDLAMGLVMSKTQNFLLKEFPFNQVCLENIILVRNNQKQYCII